MDKQFKKFIIPSSLNDESSEDVDDIPHYFRAGKVLENSKTENDSSKMSGPSCSKQNKTDKSMEYIAQKSIETKNVCDKAKTLSETEPSSNFGNAFSNLRASKFYDNTGQCTSENQVKTSEKFAKSSSLLLVNPRQRGNPLLKNIRNVPWEYNEMEPDYVMGNTTCALFLSMRYHNLFPNYIHERLKALGKSYQLRVLLVQVDILEPNQPLKDLSVIAILADCTLMVAWSPEEAGSYLETYKIFENKSADLIKEKQGDDNYSQLIDCLTTVRSVNKTDAVVLLSTFGTLEKVIEASVTDLAMCPGMGPLKAKRLYEALRRPLKNEWRST